MAGIDVSGISRWTAAIKFRMIWLLAKCFRKLFPRANLFSYPCKMSEFEEHVNWWLKNKSWPFRCRKTTWKSTAFCLCFFNICLTLCTKITEMWGSKLKKETQGFKWEGRIVSFFQRIIACIRVQQKVYLIIASHKTFLSNCLLNIIEVPVSSFPLIKM